jgi:putative flippase GtrA
VKSQFSRYVLVGAFNTLLGLVVIFGGMYVLGLSPAVSNVLGYTIGLLLSFALNREFVFRSSGQRTVEMARFLAVFLIAFGANLATLYVLVWVFQLNAAIGQVSGSGVYAITSYLLSKSYVFCRSEARSR